MSASAAEADLRARVLHVIQGFKEYFTAQQFRKAYKVRYVEKFSSGSTTTREYLKAFSELSFFEEEDKFSLNSIKVKIEEDSSSSDDDDDDEDAPEVKEEMEETNTDDVETWYDKKVFQEALQAVKKELKANPDPSVSDEDASRFVLLHLHRRNVLNLAQKALSAANKSSSFTVTEFLREWRSQNGDDLIPMEQFGFKSLTSFLTSIPDFRRINSNEFAVVSGNGLNWTPKMIIEEGKKLQPIDTEPAAKFPPKKNDSRGEEFNGKARERWYEEGEYQEGLRLCKEYLRMKEPDVAYDNAAIEKMVKLDLLKKKVLQTARTVMQLSSDGPIFVFGNRLYGSGPLPCDEVGFRSLNGFLESFPEFRRKNQVTYLFVAPLTKPGENKGDSDESSSSDEDSCIERGSTADKVPIATDDSSEEDDSEVEKKKTEKKKTLTVAQEIQKTASAQKLQKKAIETRRKARGVFSSSDSDSDDEEATAVKNVRKRENQPKMMREKVICPKANIKEKEKAEEEPKKKKAMKRSRSPVVIVLDDDEPSQKVPKIEIDDRKETRLVAEEDMAQKAISSCERTSQHAQGGGYGAEGKGRAPGNPPMDSSTGPASALLMPGAPPTPFFAPMHHPSRGEAAGRYMTFLLDQAELKGLNVDEIAMEAINTINRKMAGK